MYTPEFVLYSPASQNGGGLEFSNLTGSAHNDHEYAQKISVLHLPLWSIHVLRLRVALARVCGRSHSLSANTLRLILSRSFYAHHSLNIVNLQLQTPHIPIQAPSLHALTALSFTSIKVNFESELPPRKSTSQYHRSTSAAPSIPEIT